MPSINCPYCKKITHVTRRWVGFYKTGAQTMRLQGAFTCDHCGRASVGDSGQNTHDSESQVESAYARRVDHHWSWQPKNGVTPEILDVPDSIADAAKEAYACASVGARMAAILMARTVLEASAKASGITEGSLYVKVDALRKANLIRPAIAEAAHEIRFLGNDMAHGDLNDAPTADDAEDALALMGQVLNELFQGPALVAKMRARRVATD